MKTLILILAKVADAMTLLNEQQYRACLRILAEALSERCAIFQFCLKMYIRNELGSGKSYYDSIEDQIQCLCKLFHNILITLPASSKSWLPMEDLQGAVEQL